MSRTPSGMFLVGAFHGGRERTFSGKSPKIGKILDASGNSQKEGAKTQETMQL